MTLVSHRADFIFLKTHKTASTSVEAALEPLCAPPGVHTGDHVHGEMISEAGIIGARGKASESSTWKNHMSARTVRRLAGRTTFRRYAKITTVRNPYARMVSMFHSRMAPDARAAALKAPFDEVRVRFRDWLATRARSNNLNKLTIGPRYVIDHVLFFERLEDDFAALAARLGLEDPALPRFKTNRNKRPEPWIDYYDAEARRLVETGSAFEIAFFGYRFADGADAGPNPPAFAGRARRLLRTDPLRATNAFRRMRQSLTR